MNNQHLVLCLVGVFVGVFLAGFVLDIARYFARKDADDEE